MLALIAREDDAGEGEMAHGHGGGENASTSGEDLALTYGSSFEQKRGKN